MKKISFFMSDLSKKKKKPVKIGLGAKSYFYLT